MRSTARKTVASLAACAALVPMLAACASPSESQFDQLGSAVCANRQAGIDEVRSEVATGVTGDDASIVALELLNVHADAADALSRLTPPDPVPGDAYVLEDSWDELMRLYDVVVEDARTQLSGTGDASGEIEIGWQESFKAAMSAFGLDECAAAGEEWPGFNPPVGPGAGDVGAAPGSLPPDDTLLPPGVNVPGYDTAETTDSS